jgi:plasmid replication initiation protein
MEFSPPININISGFFLNNRARMCARENYKNYENYKNQSSKKRFKNGGFGMSDELITTNTPQTLGVTPHFVLLHNAISRSAQTLSATAQKLTAMAMALIPPDLSSLTATFSFPEFCKALGMSIGGETYKIFKEAVKECMRCVITIETEPNKKGRKKWEEFTWFIHAKFNEETSRATMTFSPKLADVLLELRRAYAKIDLNDLGVLRSMYALRIFEMAKSYESLAGKDSNQDNDWYFERSIEEFRKIFGISRDIYKETRDFRKKVIEEPVKEINKAGIGLEITTEGIKQRRHLIAIRFDCKKVNRRLIAKGRKKKNAEEQPELPKPSPKTADRREEKELEHLKELYPSEFAVLYTEELSKPHFLPSTSELRKAAASANAAIKLREKYGIVK